MHQSHARARARARCPLSLTFAAVAAFACPPMAPAEPVEHTPLVEVVRVVSDPDGSTRFARGAIPLSMADYAPPAAPLAVSPHLPANGLAFAALPAGYFGDWHPAPRRQYGLLLAGALEIETGDGERKRFESGSVFLLEDVSGQGHRTTVVGDEPALVALVPVPLE